MTITETRDSQHRNIEVYLLAALEDQDICEGIEKHLSPIIRNSAIPIQVNSDFNVPSGADRAEYKQRLFDADIVLALISVDFIDDDGIYRRNQTVIEKHNNHETVMIPILVRNCMWTATPFNSLDVLPKNLQPLNNKQFWNSPDDAAMAVASDIYDSINELAQSKAVQPSLAVEMDSVPELKATLETSQSQTTSQPRAASPVDEALQLSSATKVENTPDFKAASGTSNSQTTSKARESSPIAVDWREKYYKTVTLKRAGAMLIDQLFLFILTGIAFAIADEVGAILTIIIYVVVFPIMESSQWQGTIGKRILKLQITDREGERISYLRALWRNIMRTVVLYLYGLSVGVLLIVQYFRFKKTKKLFHDELSNTIIGERLASSSVVKVAGNAA